MAMLPGVKVVGGAVCWASGMAVDADGSPRAYAPEGSGLRGLDHLGNAGRPGAWWGLACDRLGNPIVQGKEDPAPGFLVSTTALQDASRMDRDPLKYVDSETVPYVVVPPDLLQLGVRMGDLAYACHGSLGSPAIVADVGPHGHLGEGSIALARALGLPFDPRDGGIATGVLYAAWPGTRTSPRWPRDFASGAAGLFSAWGGAVRLKKVLIG